MHSFEVYSNESACNKKVRLGLEKVMIGTDSNLEQSLKNGLTSEIFPDLLIMVAW